MQSLTLFPLRTHTSTSEASSFCHTPGVSNTPELSGLPPFPDGSTTLITGAGVGGKSQERHDRAFPAEQQEIKKTAGVMQTLSLSGPLPKETAACSTSGRQSCLC